MRLTSVSVLITLITILAAAPRAALCDDAATETASQSDDATPRTVEDLAELVRRSVVVVSFAGRDGKTKGLGSGFVIDSNGLIATNLHVIGEARPISVQTADGRTFQVRTVHATERSMDLALIRIDAGELPALELGDSDELKQGQQVVAIGNPRGLTHSVVAGVVSGRREIDGKPMIQIAMPIEQGNSGGPLLDMYGRVHGIITLKSLVTKNLGFAVAVNALKPLVEKPNPVEMSKWVSIGALDKREWTTLAGANWRQRAGRISVSGRGKGFGGRSLALSSEKPPEQPFELAVEVKLDDESGAAGLVFHSDGKQKHYGFYPSAGGLRLSRFDGPDVFSWNVLKEVRSPHYRPGEWNTLKVRIDGNRIQCFVNDEPVIDASDGRYVEGKVGLAKFRDTEAEFKRFKVAKEIPSTRPDPEFIERLAKLTVDIPIDRPPTSELIKKAGEGALAGPAVLRERAKLLERQAERLRQLADAVRQKQARDDLAALLDKKEDAEIDLLRASLLIARIDNDEVDVESSIREVDRIAADVQRGLKPDADEPTTLAAMDRHLFEELGFHGSRTDYYNRSNSYMNEVVDDREGLPIAVSVLYMEVARRLDLNVVGVGLPGHFVVRYEPKAGPDDEPQKMEGQLIDPFERGRRMSRDEAVERIKQRLGGQFDEEFLKTQTKRAILRRMVQNLFGTAQGARDAEAMLRYIETMLVIEPEDGVNRWFRAVLEYQTRRYAEALADVEWIEEHTPAGVDLQQVEELKGVLEKAR